MASPWRHAIGRTGPQPKHFGFSPWNSTKPSPSASTASTAGAEGISIADLALELGLEPTRVAVERNLEIVPRSTLGQVRVEDGDDYEIVNFVGGG